MTVDGIVWEDPAPSYRTGPRTSRWKRFVAVLAEHPGKWAIAEPDIAQSSSGHLMETLRKYGAEATSRQISPGMPRRVRVYARWPEDSK